MTDPWVEPKEHLYDLFKTVWMEINEISNYEHYLFLYENLAKDVDKLNNVPIEVIRFLVQTAKEQTDKAIKIKFYTILAKIGAIAKNYNVEIKIDKEKEPETIEDMLVILKEALDSLIKLLINKKILPPPEELEGIDIDEEFNL